MSGAKKIMMGGGAVASAYEIEQSLILDSGSDSVLSFTPSSSGSRTTWTFSSWLKVKSGATTFRFFGYQDPGGPHQQSLLSMTTGGQLQFHDDKGGTGTGLKLNRVLRDPSAWYHIVMVMDTTQGTAANRVRFYVNGELETSFAQANYPGQNASPYLNSGGVLNQINYQRTATSSCQLAETQFIDGTALTPSSFGETNSDTGQWIPKEYEGGSYGTNGFYLKFASGAIGTDSSGEGNNYTASNLANSDVVIDTPTNNFATLNPLFTASVDNTYSEGNLKTVCPNSTKGLCVATIVPTAGKYYAEFKTTAGFPDYPIVGVFDVSSATTTSQTIPGVSTKNIGYYAYNGQILAGPSGTVLDTVASWAVNDIIAVAIDYDNSTVKWYKNNTLVFTKSSADLKDVTFAFSGTSGSSGYTIEANFGQKTLAYTPPSGYVALSTANLPDPAIPLPSAHFNTVLYTGNGSTQSISGVGHQPDWVWIKNRSAADNHKVVDAVRGATKELEPNQANAETTNADGLTAFASDGFALGDDDEYNTNSEAYVSWNWKANGAGSTDTSGDINGVVSANPTAGFSIVTWTGTGTSAPNANATIPHGLGVVPDFVWYKSRVGSSWENWIHSSIISGNKRLLLQSTAAVSSINTNYLLGGEIATSTMISNNGHTTSQPVVAYCFASKPGFSKIGIYTGNGNADGVFVNCGFRPAWIMTKRTDATTAWGMHDATRSPHNISGYEMYANLSDVDGTANRLDFLSNGFKQRSSGDLMNANNGTYLYMAFAESPFKTANAR